MMMMMACGCVRERDKKKRGMVWHGGGQGCKAGNKEREEDTCWKERRKKKRVNYCCSCDVSGFFPLSLSTTFLGF